ncbi:hypothetical protein E2C01_010520 [Portunus trituberculatus]|uniref:Uncharacterized protein n=1 Tax=Portunus trituberculatus TaxID=210409 RepID=A0A5B7D8V7_PORTR|nr:hypothetical protein [Portunus trituberculatus]
MIATLHFDIISAEDSKPKAALDFEVEETDPAEPRHEEDDGDVAAGVRGHAVPIPEEHREGVTFCRLKKTLPTHHKLIFDSDS